MMEVEDTSKSINLIRIDSRQFGLIWRKVSADIKK